MGLAKCGALFFPKWASKVGFEVGKFETGWAKSHFIFFEVGYDVGFSRVKWVFLHIFNGFFIKKRICMKN